MAEDYAELVRMLRYDSDVARPYRVVAADAITALIAERDALREATDDLLSGWRYIRQNHGDLYGVGWDRAEQKAVAALNQGGSND